jgi:hypothetical protein
VGYLAVSLGTVRTRLLHTIRVAVLPDPEARLNVANDIWKLAIVTKRYEVLVES